MITILMLGGAKRVSVTRHLLEAFRRLGHQARALSYELDWKVPVAEVAEVIEGLRWNDPEVLNDLERVVKERRVNLVLPFVDPAVELCARLRQRCSEAFIPVSDEATCATMFDKVAAQQYFERAGVEQPLQNPTRGLYIAKPRTGSASKGIFTGTCPVSWPAEADPQDYLVQEYLAGAREYSIDCYVSRKGEVLSVVPRRRIETAGGEAMRSETVADSALDALARSVIAAAPLRGPITIQALRPADGRTLLMEVNPRLGGGVVTSIGAGSRITEMIAAETLGLTPAPVNDWKPGTLMVRYTQEVIFQNY